MSITVFDVLVLIWSGAAMMLTGVAVGGLLVFRTKRESYETLFPPKKGKSTGPLHVDDMFDLGGEEGTDDSVMGDDPMHKIARVQNARFISQLAKDTAERPEPVPGNTAERTAGVVDD